MMAYKIKRTKKENSVGMSFATEKELNDYMQGKNIYKTPTKKVKEPKFETRTYRVYTFKNLPEEAKEKALEKHRYMWVEDTNLAKNDDYLIDMGIDKKIQKKVGNGNILFSWSGASYDLEREDYIQFHDLKVADDELFRQELGVSKKTWKKVEYSFENSREWNTRIIFDVYPYEYDTGKTLTKEEEEELEKAKNHFAVLMNKSKQALKDDYEYQMSDEYLIEGFEANEYRFTENGDID